MTRHVVSSSEVYHLWAHQTQDCARNASNSVSFSGLIAYSYQTPIGRIMHQRVTGQRAFLVTTQSYSQTTAAKHKHALFGAIHGLGSPIFHVEEVEHGGRNHGTYSPREWLAEYAERITKAEGQLKRSRVYKAGCAEHLARLVQEAHDFAVFFELAPLTDEASRTALLAELHAEAEVARAARLEAERERARLHDEEMSERVAMWRAGSHRVDIYGYSQTLLRLSHDGREVETSRGARVPVADAERAFIVYMRGMQLAGLPIGHYKALESSPEQVRIGCHVLSRAEVERFGSSMGWSVSSRATA